MMFPQKRFIERSFLGALKSATQGDTWGEDPCNSGALNIYNILLEHKDLLNSELLAITSRLTWLAFTPIGWEYLKEHERIDKILDIIDSTTSLNRQNAVDIAIYLNSILSNIKETRKNPTLSHSFLSELLDKSNRRCYLCGRIFSQNQIIKFLDRKPYHAHPDRQLNDRWKPIYSIKNGWCIDIDHCLPISKSGTNQLNNLNLACHYCNLIKRDWISIFDVAMSHLSEIEDKRWKFHALRLISSGQCYKCNKTVKEIELTVACHSEKALPTIQNFFSTCYEHDPQSNKRFNIQRN